MLVHALHTSSDCLLYQAGELLLHMGLDAAAGVTTDQRHAQQQKCIVHVVDAEVKHLVLRSCGSSPLHVYDGVKLKPRGPGNGW
jgi:hypothetical protein